MKQLLRLNAMVVIILMTTLLLSCNSDKKEDSADKKMSDNTESQQEKNKKTAMASVNALLAGNVDETLKDVTADAVEYGDGSMGAVKSKDSIIVMLRSWRESLSEYKGDNIWAIAEGDHVAVFGDWSGTFKTDFMGMKSAGKSFKVKDVDIFTFNSEGKITEHRNIQSQAAMLSQIGAMVMAK